MLRPLTKDLFSPPSHVNVSSKHRLLHLHLQYSYLAALLAVTSDCLSRPAGPHPLLPC